jgi:hypothetical protein
MQNAITVRYRAFFISNYDIFGDAKIQKKLIVVKNNLPPASRFRSEGRKRPKNAH